MTSSDVERQPFLGDTAAASPLARNSTTLAWDNIRFAVDVKEGEKVVFDQVSGSIQAGRLTAVMGPSGSGKTSLLNILAGRMLNGGIKKVDGTISFRGRPIVPATFRTQIAYVMQEDSLFATETAYEALEFSAAMRLPNKSDAERKDLCEGMLTTLGLAGQRDTFVGSKDMAGLSGGQKKRVACGVELITNPDILFLDEPTSGLDSYAAMRLCRVLRRVARGVEQGDMGDSDDEGDLGRHNSAGSVTALTPRSVICTIHQPSSEVFELFDDVIVLGNGGLVYHGPREGLASCKGGDFFTHMGLPCPPAYNPADFIMFKLQQANCPVTPGAWRDYRLGMESGTAGLQRRGSSRIGQGEVLELTPTRAGLGRQMKYLGVRELKRVIRDKKSLVARFGTSIFIMLLVGIVFKDVGNRESSAADIRDHFGALSQIAISGMFGISQPVLLSFPSERPIFLREYASGTYSVVPYVMSKLLVDVPLSIFQAGVMIVIGYWLLGLNGIFPFIVLSVALIGLAGTGLALVIGAVAGDPTVAIQLSPVLFVPQFLFCGFFVATSQIPSWIRWAQYLCSLKYGLNLLAIAEFDSKHYTVEESFNGTNRTVDLIHDDDQGLFQQMDIKPDLKWPYFGIMMGFFLGLRLVAMALLTRRARSVVQ